MKRTSLTRRKRVNPVSKKTRTQRWPALKALRQMALARAADRCEVCTRLTPLDIHHIIKRSQGGPDTLDNVAALCRACHEQTDGPYGKRRLVLHRRVDGGLVFSTFGASA